MRQLAGRLGASPRLLGWIVGLVLAGILGVSLVAALRDSGAGPVYLGVVVTYVVVGWAAGFLSDLKQGSVLQALLWFAPFGGRWTTLFGVAHEVTSSRIHHRHPVLEAIFVNAVLAILSFVIVLVVRGLNLVSP